MDNLFEEVTPLAGVDRSGINPSTAGVVIETFEQLAIAQVFAAKGQIETVASTLGISGDPGTATVTTDYTALSLSPGQWMLHSDNGRDGVRNGGFCQQLREKLGATGYVSEQSHGRLIIRLSGPDARALMQKGCRLDLHPSVMSAGFCGQMQMAQTGVLMHQRTDDPVYDLMLYSGFARSFWHWMSESAAEYGFSVKS